MEAMPLDADAIEAARAALPPWIGWSQVVFFTGLAFLATLLVGAFNRRSIGRAERAAHWTEKARFAAAAGKYASIGFLLVSVTLVTLSLMWSGRASLSRVPFPVAGALVVAGGLAAYLHLLYRKARRLKPDVVTRWTFMQGVACLALLYFPHFVIAVLLALCLPARMDASGILILMLGVVLLVLAGTGAGVPLGRWLGLMRPAGDALRAAVTLAEKRSGIKARAVYEIRWPVANALAFPWLAAVGVTDPAVRHFTREELAAVVSHELAHLAEPRAVRFLRLCATLPLIPIVAWRPILEASDSTTYLVVVIVALGLALILKGLWRRMEVRADAAAREQEGEAGVYARVLERLYEVNLVPAVMSRFKGVHPNLYDRMVAAGVEPNYPRPKPPPRGPAIVALGVAITVAIVLTVGLVVLRHGLNRMGESGILTSMTLFGGEIGQLEWLGWNRVRNGDPERGLVFYRAAAALDPRSARYPALVALTLVDLDRPAEAEAALAEAEAIATRVDHREWVRDLLESTRKAVDACRKRVANPEEEE
jgi:Zn-dependent protease with chaperone function